MFPLTFYPQKITLHTHPCYTHEDSRVSWSLIPLIISVGLFTEETTPGHTSVSRGSGLHVFN